MKRDYINHHRTCSIPPKAFCLQLAGCAKMRLAVHRLVDATVDLPVVLGILPLEPLVVTCPNKNFTGRFYLPTKINLPTEAHGSFFAIFDAHIFCFAGDNQL